MQDDPTNGLMVYFERRFMDANMDDWFISDSVMERVAEAEYGIYLMEQSEECDY